MASPSHECSPCCVQLQKDDKKVSEYAKWMEKGRACLEKVGAGVPHAVLRRIGEDVASAEGTGAKAEQAS